MKVKKLFKILFVLTFSLAFLPIISFGYEVESKPGTIVWTNITASEAYNVCHQMSSGTSSIGSGALNPHMSTPQDYDAVSVLAISNYGDNATTSYGSYNGYYSTTNNASGVMNFGTYKVQNGITPENTFTSGMLAHASNDSMRQSIIDAINSGAVKVNTKLIKKFKIKLIEKFNMNCLGKMVKFFILPRCILIVFYSTFNFFYFPF